MAENEGNENVPDSVPNQVPEPGETHQKPEPNHISGRPYAKKRYGQSVEQSNDEQSFDRDDKEPKQSSGWNDMPKEKTRADSPQIGIE